MTEERPKRSDQLPEEGPESVVPDDAVGGGSRSAEGELSEQGHGEAADERQPGRIGDPTAE
jgi:hypothetical protein